ncbi:MAG: hypothetical protein MUF15_16090 [Acidobacteria bacterium]|jgi:hypothetical protein|nr:hypothetical protein [Acidobacteriota bacterium]
MKTMNSVKSPFLGLKLCMVFFFAIFFMSSVVTLSGAAYNWSGTTSRDCPMSFTVSVDGKQVTNFKLKTKWSSGGASGTLEITLSGPNAITNWQFSYTGSNYSYTGEFDSTTMASGTFTFTSYPILIGLPYPPYITYIYLSQTGTWTATGVFPTTPPTITTGSAASVSSNSATLNGTINPNGKSSTYYFEYGTTTSYGSTTTSTTAGSGSSAVSVSSPITGLSPNTTYHYRLVGTNSDGTSSGVDKTFTTTNPPQIALNRTQLFISATTSGAVTKPQQFTINNSGGGILNWTVTDDQGWLTCDPTSGTNFGTVSVSASSSGLSVGTYTGSITVSDANAINSPQTINVTFKVYNAGSTNLPFGDFSTPIDGSTVSSSIAVTGWVLDDVGIESLKIYIDNGQTYIGDALFVEGARPDLETAYPEYPQNYQGGWGYMLLTNFLPGGGNGVYTLSAVATDVEGHQVSLGTKTITVDNANAVKPFGAIDTPAQGGSASGKSFVNQGWLLTPMPNKILENGSTIDVYVNGVKLGHPSYNIPRADIASYFPGYANSGGPAAVYKLDTTKYSNGVHSIFWIALDNGGNVDGIGSRFFNIQNSGANDAPNTTAVQINLKDFSDLDNLQIDYETPVRIEKGYGIETVQQEIYPDYNGMINVAVKELERVTIQVSTNGTQIAGYMVVGNQLKALPIGSTFDAGTGTFYWQPGPGFIGTYELVFIEKDQSEQLIQKHFQVTINPGS